MTVSVTEHYYSAHPFRSYWRHLQVLTEETSISGSTQFRAMGLKEKGA